MKPKLLCPNCGKCDWSIIVKENKKSLDYVMSCYKCSSEYHLWRKKREWL